MGVISKIILTGKGNYDASASYELLDYVRYANCSWVAKEPVTGIAPPSDPTETSDKWTLLCRDGEYLGQYPTWNNVDEKPFDTLGDEFVVVNGELSVIFPSNAWEDIEDKPFTGISSSFTNDNDVLGVKVDGTTIYKLEDGTLVANASSTGFDIHSLQEETALGNNDEFPFYDASAGGTRKTLWSNIITKLNAIFPKIYAEDTTSVSNTTIKDSVNSINGNTLPNQLAGAMAVKDLYQYIAPLPTNAPSYSASKKYAVGDYVKFNNETYYCITEIKTPEAWNQSKWRLWNDNIPIRLGVDADGNYGYYKAGADSVTPFKNGVLKKSLVGTVTGSTSYNIAQLFPNVDLSTVTIDNFSIMQTGGVSYSSGWSNKSAGRTKLFSGTGYFPLSVYSSVSVSAVRPTLSYSGGILTVSCPYISASGGGYSNENVDSNITSNTSLGATYMTCNVYFTYISK